MANAPKRPPGLVIDATEDAYVGSELSPAVAERLDAQRVTVEAGHWWMVSDPEPVADALVAFWNAL